MVEDAGFFIDEFDGFPGVYSSYVHKTLGIKGIIKTLEGKENRDASFQCVIGIHLDGEEFFFKGECKGQVSERVLGSNGFGYDPIFIPNEGNGRTFGEMNNEEKQQFSHRGKAMDKLRAYLQGRNQSPTSPPFLQRRRRFCTAARRRFSMRLSSRTRRPFHRSRRGSTIILPTRRRSTTASSQTCGSSSARPTVWA